MHKSSMDSVSSFIKKYITKKSDVIDIGSLNTNGCYKPLFVGHNYTGIDIVEGNNVDVLLNEDWDNIKSKSADVIVSGQFLNIVEDPEFVFINIKRILKENGICCIVVPHTMIVLCKTIFTEDSLRKLIEKVDMKVIEYYRTEHDIVMIFSNRIEGKIEHKKEIRDKSFFEIGSKKYN